MSGLSAGIVLTDGVDCEPEHRFDRSIDVVERGHVGNPAKLGLGSDHEIEGCLIRVHAYCDRSEDRNGDHPVSAKSRFDGVAVQDDRFQAILRPIPLLIPLFVPDFFTHKAAVIIYSRKAIIGQFHNLPVDSMQRSSRRVQ